MIQKKLYWSRRLEREQWEEMVVNEEDREFPDAFILWGEEEVQIVSRDLTRTANVSAIEACGDSRLLLRETVSLNEKDTEGCLALGRHCLEIIRQHKGSGGKNTIRRADTDYPGGS